MTGRADATGFIRRSVEYRVTRKTKGSVAIAVERPYANTIGYAYVNQFREVGDQQGAMAVHANGSFLSVTDYERMCDNHAPGDPAAIWHQCFRPYWNRFDKVDGDLVTGGPFTVHGTKGFFQSKPAKATSIRDWPAVTGVMNVVGGTNGQLAAPGMVDRSYGASQSVTYSDTEVRTQGKQKFLLLSDEPADTAPIGQYKEIRRNAKPEQVCRFTGATQILLHGDDVYVRSPHTPNGYNQESAPWCVANADNLYGLHRNNPAADVMHHHARRNRVLVPDGMTTWVKFANVPADAIFMVERIAGGRKCNTDVVGDNDGWGNRTGVGFPANRDDSDPLIDTKLKPYDCHNGDLFIDGLAARQKTIIAEDNIYLTGAIRYADRDMSTNAIPENSDDLLGLVAQQNVFIYNPPSRQCNPRHVATCYRYPRTPFPLPVLREELEAATHGGPDRNQGSWSSTELKHWLNMPSTLGPAIASPEKTTPPTKVSWFTMPQWDAVIVAETGAFMLENPLMHNRPATIDQHGNTDGLSAVVTGAVFSRYAPLLHIDYETPSNEVKMHGLHGHYINDPRLERVLPPGFSGLSATSYRLQGFAEVGGDLHLEAKYERNP